MVVSIARKGHKPASRNGAPFQARRRFGGTTVKQAQPAKSVSTSLGVTATALARVLHVSRPTARRLLDGTYPPTPDEAAMVARYLGVPEDQLWRSERWPRPRRTR